MVFPVPGGPKKITDESLSAWIALLKSRPFPTMCSCPIYSSRLRGRIRAASGSRSAAAAVSNKSLLTVPFYSVGIVEAPQAGIFRIGIKNSRIYDITVGAVIERADRINRIFPNAIVILMDISLRYGRFCGTGRNDVSIR